jgi:hypothetical protein
MSAAALIVAFQILSLIGSALTAAKLYHGGLYRKYRFFFWYFLFRVPNTAWPLFFNNFFNTKAILYYYFWVSTEPVTWIFHTLVVLELYKLVLEKHKGLYTLGRWAMFAGIATSVTISLLSLIPKMTRSMTEQSKTMFWYLAMERGIMLGLAIFLLFMMGFLVLYTVPISGNVKIHARIYSIFFVSNYLTFLLQSLFGLHVLSWTNVVAGGVSAGCVFAWLFLLNPAGEEVQTSQPILGPEQERRVLQQLDALNATLLRVSRN